MESLDLRVLTDALAWRRSGHGVTLVTVVETWGSAPRPPGLFGSFSSATARSREMSKTFSSFGIDLNCPSWFTYGPKRPMLATTFLAVSG